MPAHSNQAAEQHFVPKFYLRRFAGTTQQIQILDLKHLRLLKQRGVKGICQERFFYALWTGVPDELSQEVEQGLSRMEQRAAEASKRALDVLLSRKALGDSLKWEIAHLMAMVWARGPSFREQIQRTSGTVTKKVMEMAAKTGHLDQVIDELDRQKGVPTPRNEREAARSMFASGRYSMEFNNWHHIRFLGDLEGFANLFFGQYWHVYINNTSLGFVTSDNPVATIVPHYEGFYPPTFLERTHYFALSPKVCIEAIYPDHDIGKKTRRATLFLGQESKVAKLNLLLASRSKRFVYAADKRPLELILEHARLTRSQAERPGVSKAE